MLKNVHEKHEANARNDDKSEEEATLARVHARLVMPLVVAILAIKGALLEPLELEAKLWPNLLQARATTVLLKDIPIY